MTEHIRKQAILAIEEHPVCEQCARAIVLFVKGDDSQWFRIYGKSRDSLMADLQAGRGVQWSKVDA